MNFGERDRPKIEPLIAAWRASLANAPGMAAQTLDELENHLRENLASLLRSGLTVTEAFPRAVAQLGTAPVLSAEFQKLRAPVWLPVKITNGLGGTAAVAMASLLAARCHGGGLGLLLSAHIFTVTIGYVTTLLLGTLGICFVCQQTCSPLPPARRAALSRACLIFGGVAAALTATGIALGMCWLKASRGYWWGWSSREMLALGVLIWLIGFISVHQRGWLSTQTLLVLSIVGNMMVSLAWLDPFLRTNFLQPGSSPFTSLLLVLLVAHFAFLLLGFTPAGWLRPAKSS